MNSAKDNLYQLLKKEVLKQLKPGQKLPTIRSLARNYNIAHQAVVQTLKRLEKEGYITKPSSTKPYCLPDISPPPDFTSKPSRKEILKEKLLQRIMETENSQLPTVQQLSLEAGSSARTVAAIMEKLANAGWVEKKGKFWYRNSKNPTNTNKTPQVLVLADSIFFGPYQQDSNRFRQALERSLKTIDWPTPNYITDPARLKDVQVHNLPGIICYNPSRKEGKFLEWAKTQKGLPLIVIHPEGDSKSLNLPSNAVCLVPDHHQAGLDMGRNILTKGFRRICVLLHLNPEEHFWAMERIRGIKEALSPFPNVECKVVWKNFLGIPSPSPDEIFPDKPLRKKFLTSGLIPNELTNYWFHEMTNLRRHTKCSFFMQKTIEEVARKSSFDAIVTINDNLAMIVWHYLHSGKKRKRVESISLYSFDNTIPSSILGITSYDLGYDKLGNMAVNILLQKKSPRSPASTRGMLFERQSTPG